MRLPSAHTLRRRAVLTAICGAAFLPGRVLAQQPGKVYRIAYLGNSSLALEADLVASFRQGLKELQYVEGRNVIIDFRWAEGRYDRFPALLAELMQSRPDAIITAGTPGALAAKRATQTIPIIMAVIADPVNIGVVPSLAHPAGNLTGSASMLHELAGKRLELLKELVPGVARIAVVWNPGNPANRRLIRELQAAARALRLRIDPLVSGESDVELEKSLGMIEAAKVDALIVEPDRALLARRERIVAFAARRRLPAVYPYREYVEAGGLASYAPDFRDMFRRAAYYFDRIAKGARPGDLPVEQPGKFDLVVDLRAAGELGLKIPAAVLARADQVIR